MRPVAETWVAARPLPLLGWLPWKASCSAARQRLVVQGPASSTTSKLRSGVWVSSLALLTRSKQRLSWDALSQAPAAAGSSTYLGWHR